MNLGMHVACCMPYMNLRISLTWVLVCVFRVYVYIWEQVVQLGCTMSDTSACDKAATLDSCLLLSVSHLFLV